MSRDLECLQTRPASEAPSPNPVFMFGKTLMLTSGSRHVTQRGWQLATSYPSLEHTVDKIRDDGEAQTQLWEPSESSTRAGRGVYSQVPHPPAAWPPALSNTLIYGGSLE